MEWVLRQAFTKQRSRGTPGAITDITVCGVVCSRYISAQRHVLFQWDDNKILTFSQSPLNLSTAKIRLDTFASPSIIVFNSSLKYMLK